MVWAKLRFFLTVKAPTERSRQKKASEQHIKGRRIADFCRPHSLESCFVRAAYPLDGIMEQLVRVGEA